MQNRGPFAAFVVSVCAVACGGDRSGSGDATTLVDPDRPLDTTLPYDCARVPCSVDEVAPAVRQRQSEVLDELVARAQAGDDLTALEAWLRGLSDIAMVARNEVSVMFRLNDGTPTGYYDSLLIPGRSGAGTNGNTNAIKHSADRRVPKKIVGQDDRRTAPDYKKKALLLAPFQWETNAGLEEVKDALKTIRDYLEDEDAPDPKLMATELLNEQVDLDAF